MEFYQKPFLNIVTITNPAKNVFLYLVVALRVTVEGVKLRGQQPNFWKKTAVFNIVMWLSVNFFVGIWRLRRMRERKWV